MGRLAEAQQALPREVHEHRLAVAADHRQEDLGDARVLELDQTLGRRSAVEPARVGEAREEHLARVVPAEAADGAQRGTADGGAVECGTDQHLVAEGSQARLPHRPEGGDLDQVHVVVQQRLEECHVLIARAAREGRRRHGPQQGPRTRGRPTLSGGTARRQEARQRIDRVDAVPIVQQVDQLLPQVRLDAGGLEARRDAGGVLDEGDEAAAARPVVGLVPHQRRQLHHVRDAQGRLDLGTLQLGDAELALPVVEGTHPCEDQVRHEARAGARVDRTLEVRAARGHQRPPRAVVHGMGEALPASPLAQAVPRGEERSEPGRLRTGREGEPLDLAAQDDLDAARTLARASADAGKQFSTEDPRAPQPLHQVRRGGWREVERLGAAIRARALEPGRPEQDEALAACTIEELHGQLRRVSRQGAHDSARRAEVARVLGPPVGPESRRRPEALTRDQLQAPDHCTREGLTLLEVLAPGQDVHQKRGNGRVEPRGAEGVGAAEPHARQSECAGSGHERVLGAGPLHEGLHVPGPEDRQQSGVLPLHERQQGEGGRAQDPALAERLLEQQRLDAGVGVPRQEVDDAGRDLGARIREVLHEDGDGLGRARRGDEVHGAEPGVRAAGPEGSCEERDPLGARLLAQQAMGSGADDVLAMGDETGQPRRARQDGVGLGQLAHQEASHRARGARLDAARDSGAILPLRTGHEDARGHQHHRRLIGAERLPGGLQSRGPHAREALHSLVEERILQAAPLGDLSEDDAGRVPDGSGRRRVLRLGAGRLGRRGRRSGPGRQVETAAAPGTAPRSGAGPLGQLVEALRSTDLAEGLGREPVRRERLGDRLAGLAADRAGHRGAGRGRLGIVRGRGPSLRGRALGGRPRQVDLRVGRGGAEGSRREGEGEREAAHGSPRATRGGRAGYGVRGRLTGILRPGPRGAGKGHPVRA